MTANNIGTGKCKSCSTQFDYVPIDGNTDPASKRLLNCPLCTEPLFHLNAISILGIRKITGSGSEEEAVSVNANNVADGLRARVASP